MRGLPGKRVLISGGSSGTGFETAHTGARAGDAEEAAAAYAFLASDDASLSTAPR